MKEEAETEQSESRREEIEASGEGINRCGVEGSRRAWWMRTRPLNTQRALQHRYTLHRVDILTACSSYSAVPKMLLFYIYIWPEYVCYLSAGAVHSYQCNYWK